MVDNQYVRKEFEGVFVRRVMGGPCLERVWSELTNTSEER